MTRRRRCPHVLLVLVLALAVMTLPLLRPGAASATPGPPSAPEYWFDSWHITTLWDEGIRGQGITIAEIDTGVSKIPELDGRVLSGTDLGSAGGDGRVDREVDPFGHGTAMASIMVASTGLLSITGIAPDAKILPIAVPLAGTTDSDEPDHLPEAIVYAADHGAKIINLSLGGKQNPGDGDQACSSDEQSAVYHAIAKGAVVVASIGNTGPTRNVVEDPAVCLGVVSVGAVDAAGTVANFSTRQPYLTLVAPGVTVPSLGRNPGGAYKGDGTSQATALTSASLALVWSKYPKLSGNQIVARVLATLDARRTTPSSAYGYGMLDTFRAVTAKVPLDAPNPVYSAAQPFLARAAGLRVPAPSAPPVASSRPIGAGDFAIGAPPQPGATSVAFGLGLGSFGLLSLLLLLLVWVRRRRSIAPAPVVPLATVAADAGGTPPAVAPTMGWSDGDSGDVRPRPRPFPPSGTDAREHRQSDPS